MTVRLTLRLPDDVYERIVRYGRASGRSVNQVIVDVLSTADLAGPYLEGMTPQQRLNWMLRDIASPVTDGDLRIMDEVFGTSDTDAPVLSHEELWAIMPHDLDPPVSQTVIDLREDRV